MVTFGPLGEILAAAGAALPEAVAAPLARAGLVVGGGVLQGRERSRETVSSGFEGIDALLPAGGVRRGSLVEWLAAGDRVADAAAGMAGGAGAVSLAFAVACRLAAAGPRTIVVVDRGGWFHPPAVLPWLADERQLVVVRPSRDDDEIWAIDQALRCRGVATVVAWPRSVAGRLAGGDRRPAMPAGRCGDSRSGSWTTAMRRWQLAARSSGAVGLFVQSAAAVREPSWAEARLAVSPLSGGAVLARRLRLERVGGAWSGGLEGRITETVLDLARGCEGRLPPEPARALAGPRCREPSLALPEVRRRGASCHAS